MGDSQYQFIRNVPLPLKRKLASEARKADTNMNFLCVSILSRAYGVEVEPDEARRTSPSGDGTDMMLRFTSAELLTAIRVAAARNGWTAPREIVHALCTHYGLRPPEQPRVAATAA